MPYRRGRRRGPRWVSGLPIVRSFGPLDGPFRGVVQLTLEELEALKLVDYEGLDQIEAAQRMGISRKSLWTDLHSARTKLARALVEGLAIQIEGGNYVFRPQSPETIQPTDAPRS
ncbi:MAG: DUF134 domain-containing protein [Euryarchaeota archaeon]|nr:DUF134 domain-containing protein [Euryarchaeota archaeon]